MAEEARLLLETLSDLRVVDLKRELEKRKLSKSGSKKDLCERLRNHLKIEELRYKNAEQGSDTISSLNLPSADAGMETNEFVKSYLEQREKLLERQMEQKKKYQEETYKSQESESQSEAEDLSQHHHQSTQQIPVELPESKSERTQEARASEGDPADAKAGTVKHSSEDASQDRPEYNSETDEDTEDEGGQYASDSKQTIDEVSDLAAEQSDIIPEVEEQVEPLVSESNDSNVAPCDEVVKTDAQSVSEPIKDVDVTMDSESSRVADVTVESETSQVEDEPETGHEETPSIKSSEVDVEDEPTASVPPPESETKLEENEPSKNDNLSQEDATASDIAQAEERIDESLNESSKTDEDESTANNSEVVEPEVDAKVSTAEESLVEVENKMEVEEEQEIDEGEDVEEKDDEEEQEDEDTEKKEEDAEEKEEDAEEKKEVEEKMEVEEESAKNEAEEREEMPDSSSGEASSEPEGNLNEEQNFTDQKEEAFETSINSEDLLEVMVQKEDEFDEVKIAEDDERPPVPAKSLPTIPEEGKEVAREKSNKNADNSTTTFSRRLLRNSQKADDAEPVGHEKPLRKRKWGSVDLDSQSVAISSQSLKGLLPEVMIDLSVPCDVMMDVIGTEDEEQPAAGKSKIFKRQNTETSEQDGEGKKRKPEALASTSSTAKLGRTIYQDIGSACAEKDSAAAINEDGERQRERRVVERRATLAGEAPERNVIVHRKESETDASQADNESELKKRKFNPSVQLIDEPVAVERGRREATPPRNPVSRFIHIFNLVRPYTLNQLKEILQRTGTLVETGFWIDKIKSHCIAEFETSEQAAASRDALHGKKWPACNPKILRVEFSDENELDMMRNTKEGNPLPLRLDRSGNIGISVALVSANVAAATADAVKATETTIKQEDARKAAREVRKSPERPKEKEVIRRREENERRREETKRVDLRPSQPPVRDWDRNKVRASVEREEERSRRRRRSSERGHRDSRDDEVKRRRRSDAENEKPVVNIQKEDPPAKLLDDLFRKTKATPCIYWLPLTEEQIAEKETQNKKLEAERLQRRADRDKKLEEERDERMKARGQRDGDRRRDF